MKWAILLGSVDISGGVYVVFEHAVRAMENGVDICMITENRVHTKNIEWHSSAKKLKWKTYHEIRNEQFDFVISTWWRTTYDLYKVQAKQYIYFVQSIESRFYENESVALRKLVDATYVMPLSIITEARWIKEYLDSHYANPVKLARNGIRKDLYTSQDTAYANRESGKIRILVEGPLGVTFKNVERTIELCKQSTADEIWLLTSTNISYYEGIDKVFSRVPIIETPLIYRSCDVLVKLSYVEGMFGPPLEMFHCGGTAIVYDVTGHDEYIHHNVNALVVDKDDEEQVVEYINIMKTDERFLNQLKIGAKNTASNWPDWSEASAKFEKMVSECFIATSASQKMIKVQSKFFYNFYEIAEKNSGQPYNPSNLHKIRYFVIRSFPRFYEKLRYWKRTMKELYSRLR